MSVGYNRHQGLTLTLPINYAEHIKVCADDVYKHIKK